MSMETEYRLFKHLFLQSFPERQPVPEDHNSPNEHQIKMKTKTSSTTDRPSQPSETGNIVGNIAILRDRHEAQKRQKPLRHDLEMICRECVAKLDVKARQLSYSEEYAFCQECGRSKKVTSALVPVY